MLRKLLFCFAILVIAAPAAADDATRCSRETGDVAIAACTRAINSSAGRQDPKYAQAYYNRGNAYSNKGDTDRAIADYTAAIQLDPTYANAYYNRGNGYSNKGDTARAIADYSEAIRLEPTYANAYYNRGNAYGNKDYTHRAIADYTETIRLDPTYANAYLNRGLAYEKLADFPKRDLTSTLRSDWDQRPQNGRRTRRESGLPSCLHRNLQRRCARRPTSLQLLLRPLHRCRIMIVASPLSLAILLMKTWPHYRTLCTTQTLSPTS